MAFSPFARFRNFTLDNLKSLLEMYPEAFDSMDWDEMGNIIESRYKGYKKTSYQQACQFGLEDKSDKKYRIQNYLYNFDESNLRKYIEFWACTYYAPNPYVYSNDEAILIFCEISKKILESPNLELDYYSFFNHVIGGKSDDILLNILKSYCSPLKYKKIGETHYLYIDEDDRTSLENKIKFIEDEFPIIDSSSRKLFFDRYTYKEFCKYYKLENEEDHRKSHTNFANQIGFNKIFYGIPGCGKSYKIDAMLNHKPEFVDEAIKNKIAKKADESDIIRTTFYLDYSNSDFIGQIYPCVEKVEVNNDDGSVDYKSIVTYKRIPGPFTKALLQAYQHLIDKDNSQVYLIIEEINRGNAAAIFGDTFQLLDRKNGDSEYPINNEFIESYLRENLENIEKLPSNYNLERIMIPHNLTIFATMNTSDQNVFPLDTAFKRRWNRERITNDWENVGHIKDMYVPYTDITWENFAKTINKEMISQSIKKDAPISEDKQMGAYFANEDMLTDKSYSEKIKKNISLDKDLEKLNNFENNILDYLYNDVTKFDHSILFEKQLNSIDNIYERINLYIDAINDTGAEQAESKCVFNKVFVDEITEKMLGFVTKADDGDD